MRKIDGKAATSEASLSTPTTDSSGRKDAQCSKEQNRLSPIITNMIERTVSTAALDGTVPTHDKHEAVDAGVNVRN